MDKQYADSLKCNIIDFFVAQNPSVLIGNEIMYGSNKKVVDLLAIENRRIIAIEIKSAHDSTYRLQEQIEEYMKVFDKVYIFSSCNKIDKILNMTPSCIGVYEITDKYIRPIRRGTILKQQSKSEMLSSMNLKFLRSKFNIQYNLDSDQVRELLKKRGIQTIHQALLEYYTQRIKAAFNSYMNDRGKHSIVDDLTTLSPMSIVTD